MPNKVVCFDAVRAPVCICVRVGLGLSPGLGLGASFVVLQLAARFAAIYIYIYICFNQSFNRPYSFRYLGLDRQHRRQCRHHDGRP